MIGFEGIGINGSDGLQGFVKGDDRTSFYSKLVIDFTHTIFIFIFISRLNGNPLGDDGILSVLKALKNSTTVMSLDIGRCEIADEGGQFIQDFLCSNTSLAELTLSQNRLSEESWSCISSALQCNTTLKTLSIDACAIGDKELKTICAGISNNTGLRCLDIEENMFTEQVANECFIEAITKCQSLVDVTMEPCPNLSNDFQEKVRLLLESRLENLIFEG